MIQKRRVLINAIVSALQVVVVGGLYFVLYPFLLRVLGEDQFGVWALVLATTSATNVANLGLAGSTVKFVAQYLARGREAYVHVLIQTAALSVAGILLVILALLYPALKPLLAFLIGSDGPELVAAAHQILPYSLAAFWLTSLAGVFQSCIEGFQRVDLRSLLVMMAAVLYLGFAFGLVPERGLVGLAQAQVAQAGILMLASWLVLRHLMPSLPLAPLRWQRPAFREMLSYSINFQVISVTQMLTIPTTTALLSRLGSVSAVTYFEMANRMVTQLRALLVAAHQAIVPTIADLQERAPETVRRLYATSMHLLLYLTLAALPLLIAATPLIAEVYVGAYNPQFILFADLLFVGWFFNILANPAYFANLGTGALRWNVIGHLAIAGTNVTLGGLLGVWLGEVGVVVGLGLALLSGTLVIAGTYHREHNIAVSDLVQPATLRLAVVGLAGLALVLYVYHRLTATWPFLPLLLILTSVYMTLIAYPVWRHPARHQLTRWLRAFRSRTSPQSPTVDP